MKNIITILVTLCTAIVFVNAVLAQTGLFQKVFMVLIIAGPILFMYTVYRILKDNYTTDKTFDDWYEDAPRKRDND